MKQIHKDYPEAFLLEPTKLTRILDKIHERISELNPAATRDNFEVFLSGNRREELDTLDDVFALENSRRHRIERLLLVSSASTDGAMRPEHEVQADFGFLKTGSNGTKHRVIAVSIRSDQSGWASRTLSEIEEQVERTHLRYTPPVLALVVILISILFAVVFQFGPVGLQPDFSKTMWLRAADANRLEQILSQNRPITDEEMREITTMQLRNLMAEQRADPPSPGSTRRALFLGLPLALVLGCVIVLAVTCYPKTVFLWGDEVERYAQTVQRRKAAWGIIISVLVVGVLSKFLFESVSAWLPK